MHNQFHNQLLPDAGTYCKIACFLYNLTAKRLESDTENLEVIIQRMKLQKSISNHLAQKVQEENLNKKSVPFASITSNDLLDFPELSIDDLKLLFTGTYQLKQAISYLGEMLQDDNSLPISFLKNDREIVKFEVRSRHINSKTYKCYVNYDKNNTGLDAIKGYCCNCANGLRTVGCCSHIAALIYHLSYGRYLSKVIRPAEVLSYLFDKDNVCPIIDEDSEED